MVCRAYNTLGSRNIQNYPLENGYRKKKVTDSICMINGWVENQWIFCIFGILWILPQNYSYHLHWSTTQNKLDFEKNLLKNAVRFRIFHSYCKLVVIRMQHELMWKAISQYHIEKTLLLVPHEALFTASIVLVVLSTMLEAYVLCIHLKAIARQISQTVKHTTKMKCKIQNVYIITFLIHRTTWPKVMRRRH